MSVIQGGVRAREAPSGSAFTIAIPALAGALICVFWLGTRSFWLDEGATFAIASQHGAALGRGLAHDGGDMLLYYLLIHVLIGWFGAAAWLLRLPSLIATAATGALVAALALRLFEHRRVAISAGLITVAGLPLVYWGQNARGYALLVTFTIASFLALTAILQTPRRYQPSWAAIGWYVVSLLIAFYLGYDVILVIPAQLALLLIVRERARLVIGCLVLVAILCIPLAVLAIERGSGQLFWVTPLSFRIVRQAAVTLISAGLPPSFHYTVTTDATEVVMGLASVGGILWAGWAALGAAHPAGVVRSSVLLSARGRRHGAPRDLSWSLLLVLGWLLITAALAVLLLAVGEPIELPRMTTLLMPALALLIGWALWQPVLPTLGSLALVAVVLGLRLAQLAPAYGVSPEPWNAATAYVLAHTSSHQPACVALYPQDGRNSFDYYVLRSHHGPGDPAPNLRPVLPSLAWRQVGPFVERYASLDGAQRAHIQTRCSRLWLIASHQGQRHGTPQSQANRARYLRLERAFAAAYPHTRRRTFGWASPIKVRLYWR